MDQAQNLLALSSASLLGAAVYVLLFTFTTFIGCRYANIERVTYIRCFLITLPAFAFSVLFEPVVPILSFAVSVAIYAALIKYVFKVEWGAALNAWLYSVFATVVLFFIVLTAILVLSIAI